MLSIVPECYVQTCVVADIVSSEVPQGLKATEKRALLTDVYELQCWCGVGLHLRYIHTDASFSYME